MSTFVCRKCNGIISVWTSLAGMKYVKAQLCPKCMYPNIYNHLEHYAPNCGMCKEIEKSFLNINITDKEVNDLEVKVGEFDK